MPNHNQSQQEMRAYMTDEQKAVHDKIMADFDKQDESNKQKSSYLGPNYKWDTKKESSDQASHSIA